MSTSSETHAFDGGDRVGETTVTRVNGRRDCLRRAVLEQCGLADPRLATDDESSVLATP